MDDCDNITFRKIHRSSSLTDMTRDNSGLFDTTMMSLPNTSLNISQTVLDLNDKVKQLSDDLLIAHQEIDNLNSENFRLKSDLQKHLKIIETYKNLNISDNKNVTPRTGQKRKPKQKMTTTPISKSTHTMTSPLGKILNDTTDTPKSKKQITTTPQSKNKNETIEIQRVQTSPCTGKKNTKTKQTQTIERDHLFPTTTNIVKQGSSNVRLSKTTENIQAENTLEQSSTKHKICLISSETTNSPLSDMGF